MESSKKNTLHIAVWLLLCSGLPLLLSGCGDEDSHVREENQSTVDQQDWFSYFATYVTDGDYLFDKYKLNIHNNQLYLNIEALAYNDDFTTQNLDNFLVSNDYYRDYLSFTGDYYALSSQPTAPYGYLLGNINVNQPQKLSFDPLPSQSNHRLTITDEFEIIDLAGKPMAEYISPRMNAYAKNSLNTNAWESDYFKLYANTFQQKTFPAGSLCRHLISSNQSIDALHLSKGDFSTYTAVDEEPMDLKYQSALTFGSYSIWQSKEFPESYLVPINGIYTYAFLYPAGEKFNQSQQIQEVENELRELQANPESLASDIQFVEADLNHIKNKCHWFNAIASAEIDRYTRLK